MSLPLLADLPLHLVWLNSILCAAFALSLLVGICGILYRRVHRDTLLPPLPFYAESSFPTRWDAAYTVLFLLFFAGSSLDSGSEPPDAEQTQLSRGVVFISILLTGMTYLPMALRLLLLPGTRRARTWVHSLLRDVKLALLAALAVIAAAFIYEQSGLEQFIIDSTDCPRYQWIVREFMDGDLSSKVFLAIGAIVIAPIGEECCFRGFLYGTLRKYAGPVWACICSSLVFAAVHMAMASLLPLVIFAVAQCIIYEKTRSLRAPIMMHALFNTLELVIMLFLPPHV